MKMHMHMRTQEEGLGLDSDGTEGLLTKDDRDEYIAEKRSVRGVCVCVCVCVHVCVFLCIAENTYLGLAMNAAAFCMCSLSCSVSLADNCFCSVLLCSVLF